MRALDNILHGVFDGGLKGDAARYYEAPSRRWKDASWREKLHQCDACPYHCEDGRRCGGRTTHGKDYCLEHLLEGAHAARIAGLNEQVEREDADARRGVVGEDAIRLHDVLMALKLHGARTRRRLALDVEIPEVVLVGYLRALQGWGMVRVEEHVFRRGLTKYVQEVAILTKEEEKVLTGARDVEQDDEETKDVKDDGGDEEVIVSEKEEEKTLLPGGIDEAKFRSLYDAGLDDAEIAKEFNTGSFTARRARKLLGLPPHFGPGRRPLTDAARARAALDKPDPAFKRAARLAKAPFKRASRKSQAKAPSLASREGAKRAQREAKRSPSTTTLAKASRARALRRRAATERRVKAEVRPVVDVGEESLRVLAADPRLLKVLLVQLAVLAPDPLPYVAAARVLEHASGTTNAPTNE